MRDSHFVITVQCVFYIKEYIIYKALLLEQERLLKLSIHPLMGNFMSHFEDPRLKDFIKITLSSTYKLKNCTLANTIDRDDPIHPEIQLNSSIFNWPRSEKLPVAV